MYGYQRDQPQTESLGLLNCEQKPSSAAAAATTTCTAQVKENHQAMLWAGEISKTGSSVNSAASDSGRPSRYESQKRRDWNTFGQYLRNHRPPLTLSRCSGAHVLEFLRYLDQFGKTKVHTIGCPFFGNPRPPAPCPCPLRQAWGSLDALIGRLRAAFEENGGQPEANPFGARAVRLYLREVRNSQAKARGIPYDKKRKKRASPPQQGHGLVLPPPAPTAAIAPSRPTADLNSFSGGHPLDLHSHLMMLAGETGNRRPQ